MNNFEEITKNPETLGAFLRGLPVIEAPWDEEFQRKYCAGCGKVSCDDGSPCPYEDKRNNPLWWLSQESGGGMSRKEQQHGGVKLTAKTARTLAMQEFGTARGLTKSTSFVGAYFMEFGNLRIEICADAACIAVRVVLAHGTGSSVKYFDPDTLQENFKAIDKHREDEDRAIISDWVNLNGPEYCRKQVEAIWKQGG